MATFEECEDKIWNQIISVLKEEIQEIPLTIVDDAVLKYEDALEIYPHQHRVIVSGEEVRLSHYEYKVLYFLAQHPAWVFSQEQIFEAVWQTDSESCFHVVANTISRLRKKIEPLPSSPVFIKTVAGHGYKIAVHPIPSS